MKTFEDYNGLDVLAAVMECLSQMHFFEVIERNIDVPKSDAEDIFVNKVAKVLLENEIKQTD